MENIFQSANSIQEKREILKGLSKPLQALKKEGTIDSVNEGLKGIYAQSGHTELKTLRQWNKAGKRIKKGEKALCLWGSPKERNKEESGQNEGEESDPLNFYPICYVFSNLQVN